MDNHKQTISAESFLPSLMALLLIWGMYWGQVTYRIDFQQLAIFPRKVEGLLGVFFAPLLHGSLEHIFNNSIPLAVLLFFLFHFYPREKYQVIVIGWLLSGLLTWVFGRPSYHLGSSSVIYVLASFLFFSGLGTKNYRYMALALTVVFIYGSMIWYVLPIKDGISWEGHLSGFIVGLGLSFFLKIEYPPERKFVWEEDNYREEEDEFMRHFDREGNFLENVENGNVDTENREAKIDARIVYEYKPNKSKDGE